jgi:hypothetical protein
MRGRYTRRKQRGGNNLSASFIIPELTKHQLNLINKNLKIKQLERNIENIRKKTGFNTPRYQTRKLTNNIERIRKKLNISNNEWYSY